jgi:hypothetical protein
MNLQEHPTRIKNDIEDQSLQLLSLIKDSLVVIGGWGVRAHAQKKHGRYTLDIDAVADEKGVQTTKNILSAHGLSCRSTDWGFQLHTPYKPSFPLSKPERELVLPELRVEISRPRITELQTDHYFEFSLTDYDRKKICFHSLDRALFIHVPPVADLTAVKLGLPGDYKNIFDSIVLLQLTSIEDVISAIKRNDSWDEMVLRRIPKYIGRLHNKNSLVHRIAVDAHIDIKKSEKKLCDIRNILRAKQ